MTKREKKRHMARANRKSFSFTQLTSDGPVDLDGVVNVLAVIQKTHSVIQKERPAQTKDLNGYHTFLIGRNLDEAIKNIWDIAKSLDFTDWDDVVEFGKDLKLAGERNLIMVFESNGNIGFGYKITKEYPKLESRTLIHNGNKFNVVEWIMDAATFWEYYITDQVDDFGNTLCVVSGVVVEIGLLNKEDLDHLRENTIHSSKGITADLAPPASSDWDWVV